MPVSCSSVAFAFAVPAATVAAVDTSRMYIDVCVCVCDDKLVACSQCHCVLYYYCRHRWHQLIELLTAIG